MPMNAPGLKILRRESCDKELGRFDRPLSSGWNATGEQFGSRQALCENEDDREGELDVQGIQRALAVSSIGGRLTVRTASHSGRGARRLRM